MTKEKFTPYIIDDVLDMGNGILLHKRKKYRARTVYDWMPPMIEFGNYMVQWMSCFDSFPLSYWKDSYVVDLITGRDNKPLESHYGNSKMSFLFNLFAHFKTKDELIANIERWCNYYRKHVTDTLSTYSGQVLVADVMLQRCGLSSGIKQQYFNHTLAEIESTDVREYYFMKYEIFDTHIVFYDNGIYPNMPSIKLHFK